MQEPFVSPWRGHGLCKLEPWHLSSWPGIPCASSLPGQELAVPPGLWNPVPASQLTPPAGPCVPQPHEQGEGHGVLRHGTGDYNYYSDLFSWKLLSAGRAHGQRERQCLPKHDFSLPQTQLQWKRQQQTVQPQGCISFAASPSCCIALFPCYLALEKQNWLEMSHWRLWFQAVEGSNTKSMLNIHSTMKS